MAATTTYQLHIKVEQPIRVQVGRLGDFMFPAGRYIYTGSAKQNFEARIARHLRMEKALRWHIDYLLADPKVSIVGVKRSIQEECTLNQRSRGKVLVPGFGSSDCQSGCGSHLRYFGDLQYSLNPPEHAVTPC